MKRLKRKTFTLIYHFDDCPEESNTLELDSHSTFWLSREGQPETRKEVSLVQACEMIQRGYRNLKGAQGDPSPLLRIIISKLKARDRAMRKEGKVPITVCGLTVYVRPSLNRFIRQAARAQKIPLKRMAAKLFRKQLETVP